MSLNRRCMSFRYHWNHIGTPGHQLLRSRNCSTKENMIRSVEDDLQTPGRNDSHTEQLNAAYETCIPTCVASLQRWDDFT
jgi:hypothetical protein